MLSRRQGRLSRFRKNKRRLRERLRQRIFFRDRMMPEAMDKPRVVVLTGAGISAESGIRTFRAADGLWEEHRVEDVATPEGFARDPDLVQAFYNARRRQLQQPDVAPNAAHLALARLEEALGDRFLLVTQNIDNLHERAGDDEWLLVLREESDAAVVDALMAAFRLTTREAEVLYWVIKGKTSPDIGEILGSSPRTVNKHLEHVFAKLGVENRTAAASVAMARIRMGGGPDT